MAEYLDLRDLADEYTALKERTEDEDKINPLDEEEQGRLEALKALDDQLFTDMGEYADNEPTMIPEDEFEDYAQDFAYDVGFAKRDDNNPLAMFIDWAGWAESLKMDYTEVAFERETYLIRAY